MAILSGFKSFERYLKVPTNDGNKYQLMSERTLAKDVIFDSGRNLEEVMENEIGSKVKAELTRINSELDNVLYIVSFDSSSGTLVTRSADYTG